MDVYVYVCATNYDASYEEEDTYMRRRILT
jgi:hypothetical protein